MFYPNAHRKRAQKPLYLAKTAYSFFALLATLNSSMAPASAAEQELTAPGATANLTSDNSAIFSVTSDRTTTFTILDGVNVGDRGVIVSPSTINSVGKLNFAGTSTATGNIGLTTNRLGILQIGTAGTGSIVTLKGGLGYMDDVNYNGLGELRLESSIAVTNDIDFLSNATAKLTIAAGVNITAVIDNTGAVGGNVTFEGNSTVTGAIGTTNFLNTVTLEGTNTTVTGTNGMKVSTLNLNGNDLSITTGIISMASQGVINTTITSPTSIGRATMSTAVGPLFVFNNTTVNISLSPQAGYISTGTTFTIINGVTGNTAAPITMAINDDSAILSFTQVVNADDLIVTATRDSTYNAAVTAADGTANATTAATNLDVIGAAGATAEMAIILSSLDALPTNAAIADAIAQITPEVNNGTFMGSVVNQNQSIAVAGSRMVSLRSGPNSGVMTGFSTGGSSLSTGNWIKAFTHVADQDSRDAVAGYHSDTFGLAAGVDKLLFNDFLTVGAAYSFARSQVDATGAGAVDGTGTDIDSHQGMLYMGLNGKNLYLDAIVNGAYNNYKGTRKILFGAVRRSAEADYDGWQGAAKMEGGYNWHLNKLTLTPSVSLQYTHLSLDAYTEANAGALNLNVDAQNFDVLQSGLGFKVGYEARIGSGILTPEVHGKWLYDSVGDKHQTTSTFTGGGASFSTNGVTPAQVSYNMGASLSFTTDSNITVMAAYDREAKNDFRGHSGSITFRYEF